MQVRYSIDEHRHRFSAWAASRAASTKTCRFNVLQGKHIIEAIGLHSLVSSPNLLPTPSSVDATHQGWRTCAIAAASARDLTGFTHGIAAKLINCYIKSAFVCAGHHGHPNVAAQHPPIDALLLDNLYIDDAGGLREHWGRARDCRWSKFSSDEYGEVIKYVRQLMGDQPLWAVEHWWPGHQ